LSMAANQKLTRTITNRQIDKVRHEDDTLHLDFADGSTMQIKLAGPTSSVMIRDKAGKLEYSD
jgi:hypothetical protein